MRDPHTHTVRHLVRGLALATLAASVAPLAPLHAQDGEMLTVRAERLSTGGSAPSGDDVRPGDVLRYELSFTNTTDGPVEGVVFEDPIPGNLTYVAGSATADRGDVRVSFSIDGGATWSERPTVEVVEDGRTVRRPAPAALYTHIRWTVPGSLDPGGRITASFQALVGTLASNRGLRPQPEESS